MKSRIIPLAVLALLLLPMLPTAHAAQLNIEVSAQYLNYNIIMLKIKGLGPNTPPSVKVTVKDANGNVLGATDVSPYYLIAGYRSDGWVVLLALNDTFKDGVFGYQAANTSDAYINTTDGTIYSFNNSVGYPVGNVSAYFKVALANPAAVALSPPYEIAIDGKVISYINNSGTTLGARDVWPLVNALYLSPKAASLEIKIDAAGYETTTTTIQLGSAGFVSTLNTYLNIAPEKKVTAPIEAPTVAADPTAANSLAYKYSTPVTITTATNGTQTIGYNAFVTAAQKAAALEAGVANLNTAVQVTLANNTNSAKLTVALNPAPPAAATLTVYVKLGLNLVYYDTNGNVVFNVTKNAFLALTPANATREIFNITGLNLTGNAKLDVNILCAKTIVIPASVNTNINGLQGNMKLENQTTIGGYTAKIYSMPADYVFIGAVAGTQQNGFDATIRMVGRSDIPSYEFIKELYAYNEAPVTITFTDSLGQESYITSFIKLQTGELTVPATIKPAQDFTIQLQDIDAYMPVATVKLLDKNGNTIAQGIISLEETQQAGNYKTTLSVILAKNAAVDATNGIIVINNTVAKIETIYVDKYGAGGSQVIRKGYTAVEFWPVEFTAPQETYPRARVDLTLSSNNFNNNPQKIESITLQTAGTAAELYYNGLEVGKITAIIIHPDGSTTTVNPDTVFRVREFFENGTNSGTYTIYFYTSGLNLKAGDKLNITYIDLLNGMAYSKIVNVKVFVGKLSLEYEGTQITSLPIAAADVTSPITKEFTLKVDDPDANLQLSKPDNITVTVKLVLQNGTVLARNVTLKETDVDTGVFAAQTYVSFNDNGNFNITFINASGTAISIITPMSNLPLARIEFVYYDQSAGKYVTLTVPFRKPSNAKLTIEPATVPALPDKITITLIEPDLDIIPGSGNDMLPGSLRFYISIDGIPSGTINVSTLENIAGAKFAEVKEGVFQINVTARDLLGYIFNGNPLQGLGHSIALAYRDPAGVGSVQGSLVQTSTQAAFKVQSHDAKLEVNTDKVSPYGEITIKIEDPDLAGQTWNYIASNNRLVIAATRNIPFTTAAFGNYIQPIYPASTNLPSENGTFVFKLLVYQATKQGWVNRLGDTIVIVYRDDTPATLTRPLMKTVKVVTELGKVLINGGAKEVTLGTVNITVKDFDANTDPTRVETIPVTVWTSALPTRRQVQLVETGPNTGVFTTVIRLTDNPQITTNTFYAPPGSTLYVEYDDQLAPNMTPGQAFVPVVAEAKVVQSVAAQMPLQPNPQQVKLLDPITLKPITAVKAGKPALVVVPVRNTASQTITVYAWVVIYKDNVPVAAGVSVGSVGPNAVVDLPVTLPPVMEPGTYTVKIILLQSLETLTPLSKTPVQLTIQVQ